MPCFTIHGNFSIYEARSSKNENFELTFKWLVIVKDSIAGAGPFYVPAPDEF